MLLDPRKMDRRITFQQLQPRDGPPRGGDESYADFATCWAWVQEMLPSRGERIVGNMDIALRPTRIRIRYRIDITADMRIAYAGRTLAIIAPPVELGRREGLEIMAQDVSTTGSDG